MEITTNTTRKAVNGSNSEELLESGRDKGSEEICSVKVGWDCAESDGIFATVNDVPDGGE